MVASIVIVGWTIAAAAYLSAPPTVDDPDVYEMQHSRRYLREVERIGGKAGIFANDLDEWVSAAWEGKARGYTIAVLTIAVAGAYVLVTRAAIGPRDG